MEYDSGSIPIFPLSRHEKAWENRDYGVKSRMDSANPIYSGKGVNIPKERGER